MLGKLRNLSRLVRSLTRSSQPTRRSSRSVIAEPIEPRLLLSHYVFYVDANSPTDGNGQSWATASRTLSRLILPVTPFSGDTWEIRVADGTYKPTALTDRNATFTLKNRVAVYGGYAGYGAADPDARNIAAYPSILSGDIGVAGTNTDNSYHVVTASYTDSTAILDGCTIRAGYANGSGGGMYNGQGSPTIRNCRFIDNFAVSSGNGCGGGIYNLNASPTLINCVFTGNSAVCTGGWSGYGGGMYNSGSTPILTNCVFSGNSASGSGGGSDGDGGGMYNAGSSPRIIDCTFNGNSATLDGGGMANRSSSSPTLEGCVFAGNSSKVSGGGMSNDSSSPTLFNCVFDANSVSGSGGGMHNFNSSPILSNCVFNRNIADSSTSVTTIGGGICNAASSVTLTNCTFTGNAARSTGTITYGGGMAYAGPSSVIVNCVFSGNSAKYGGGMTLQVNGSVINCTFVANSAGVSGGGLYVASSTTAPPLTNCILWGNTAPAGKQIHATSAVPTVTYSNIQGGYAGSGNINADPLFVRSPSSGPDSTWGTADDDYGDLRLRLNSPAIDAGKNAAVPAGASTDILGGTRFSNVAGVIDTGLGTAPIVDMGAFESHNASAGGPYAMLEEETHVFHGMAASDMKAPFTYAWDFDNDGEFDDATGEVPTFSAAGVIGPLTLSISMRVTDSIGASATHSTTVFVTMVEAYVDDSAAGTGSGRTWTDAYTSLQTALAMSAPGQVIRVAQGTYKPTTATDRTATFQLRNGVTIEGGYAGVGAANPDLRDIAAFATVLSGNIGNAASFEDNSYHVVTGSGTDATTILDGFTIAEGATLYDGRYGAGMYNDHGSPTIRNCTFTRNIAYRSNGGGAGMYNLFSSPTVVNCIFINNIASTAYDSGQGGGIYNSSSSPTLINCTFNGNTGNSGGGIYNLSSFPALMNCTFVGNSAGSGGGIYNDASSPVITNCAFSGNIALGSAMYNRSSTCAPKMTNCIFWGNESSLFYGGAGMTIAYSNVQGGYTGTGNINADPRFVRNPSSGPDRKWATPDDDYGDLRLQLTSPCIDAGRNDVVPAGTTTDLAGNPRFANITDKADTGLGSAPIVDMGAYEAVQPAPLLLPTTDTPDTFTLRLSPDGLSLQYWPTGSPDGQPAAVYPLAGLTTCSLAPSAGLDTLRLDFSNGVPIPAAGLILPADDQIIVTADDATRPELLHTLRALLAAGRIASTSADPARALSPSIDDDGDILLRLALRGDLTGDDALDGDDYFALDRAFLAQDDLTPQADLTLDNRIDAADYFLLDRAFLTLAPPVPAASAPSSTLFNSAPSPLQDLLL